MKILFKTLIALIVATNISQASSLKHPPAHPPKESVLACVEREAEDECEFTHEANVLSGTCFSPSENLPLACKPYGHPEKLAQQAF